METCATVVEMPYLYSVIIYRKLIIWFFLLIHFSAWNMFLLTKVQICFIYYLSEYMFLVSANVYVWLYVYLHLYMIRLWTLSWYIPLHIVSPCTIQKMFEYTALAAANQTIVIALTNLKFLKKQFDMNSFSMLIYLLKI